MELDDATVTVTAGDTAGVAGQEPDRQMHQFASRLRALWEVDRLCQERETQGFELLHRDDTRAPLSHGDFESALRADPDGEENYLVHADWLQSHGDPTGQLIAVQHALMNAAPGSDRQTQLARQEAALLFEHRRHLWGPLGEHIIDPHLQLYATELFAPEWHLGYLRSVEFQLLNIDLPPALDTTLLARSLFDLHIARLLRGIGVRPHCSRDWPGLLELPQLIAELAPPTLRWLRFGHHDHWHQIPELRIGEHMPALTSLSLCARQIHLPGALPATLTGTLTDFAMATFRITEQHLETLARAHWPALTSLSLRRHRLALRAAESHFTAARLRPLLSAENSPELTSLTLCGTRDTDELCHLLASSPLAERLTHLDISFGALSTDGVELLASRALPRLRRLIAIENPISRADAQRLQYAAPTVEVHPLREEWDDD